MIGYINYLNLLPFYYFLKKKKIKIIKSPPSTINKLFEKRKIDAAFISSIKSKYKNCFDVGIVSYKEVKSVLVCNGNGEDKESDTSNYLAKVLNIKGKVIIGDKALKHKNCIDLANEWFKKYKLPFVFARFCINKKHKFYKKLINEFLYQNKKIPYYYLKEYAKSIGITYKEARLYLENNIYYNISFKEKRSLKKFLNFSKTLQ